MNFDFTLNKYRELCKLIISTKYKPLTVKKYLLFGGNQIIIMRHDVDKAIKRALLMAKLEHEYNISSTYYFRYTENVFDPKIITKIADLGHEIGYHYEVMDKARGDSEKAIIIFEKELKEFRKFVDVTTICMHGNPLTPWLNRNIWKNFNYTDFGIIGEAYLSLDNNKVYYFTDTGRKWNNRLISVKDFVPNTPHHIKTNSTDDVMNIIRSENLHHICIQTHPNRWSNNFREWLTELIYQNIKNVGKALIVKRARK